MPMPVKSVLLLEMIKITPVIQIDRMREARLYLFDPE
jgi:hypothetical protein